jgi:O6-methylguanine-DNA--protein-cysteine methyltransferase
VIGASGALVGFGGGLEVKEYLINFERGAIEFKF